MELFFLILTVAFGVAEGVFLIWGYLSHLRKTVEPKWRKTVKLTFFCAFFACWYVWNIFRNF